MMNPTQQILNNVLSTKQSLNVNWQRVNNFRQEMHRFPQGAFEQFQTGKRVRIFLKQSGIEQKYIKSTAKTGLVVDIENPDGDPSEASKDSQFINSIAIRADLDGLNMKEQTNLPYSSQTNFAHMCGHDGHTTCLLTAADILIRNRKKLPSNKKVRLLFQPAEEKIGGALPMIKEGCLDNIDQVYGFHNVPYHPIGLLSVKPGEMMACSSIVKIVIEGKGGHGSMPHVSVNPLTAACLIYLSVVNLPATQINCKDKAAISLTTMNCGQEHNVIAKTAVITGTVRTFDLSIAKYVKTRIEQIARDIAKAKRCVINDNEQEMVKILYPPVINHQKQTKYVEEVGRKLLGADNVTADQLPFFASEDYSYYLQHKPGCYLFFGSGQFGKQNPSLHSNFYNYPDELTPIVSSFWIRLIEHRLGVKLID